MSITTDIDLRDKLGGARDQGPRPTCLVFAVSAAHEVKRASSDYLSPEFLHYSGAQRSHKDPTLGLTRSAVRDALMHDGQPLETAWPYSMQLPKASAWKPPSPIGPTHLATIDFAPRTAMEVRDVLSTGTPVLLVIAVTLAMYTPDGNAIVRTRVPDPVTARRHAILAVGWGHADDGDYILVRNSWGPNWGQVGHGWLHEPYLSPRLQTTGTIA